MKRGAAFICLAAAACAVGGNEGIGSQTAPTDMTDGSGGGGGGSFGAKADADADAVDPNDRDGDGYAIFDDCNDESKSINPGAIEILGDGIDNDCNGKTDEASASCDLGLAMTSKDGFDFARSIGLCAKATAAAQGKARTWGVLAASIETTDRAGAPMPRQYAIQKTWGTQIVPPAGESMVALSSGVARTPGQAEYVPLPKGADSTTNANAPPAGFPKNAAGCPISSLASAFDSVVLRLDIRVPTNANALSFDFKFYTSEYVEYVCQAYNDSFITLLDTKAPLDPKQNKNISFGAGGDPINVNSAFFQACAPDTAYTGKKFACPLGIGELAGTGFDAVSASLGKLAQNGATDWLRTTAPVVPGEEMTIRFMIWNVGDHWLPSSVLVDNWQWSTQTITEPVTKPPR